MFLGTRWESVSKIFYILFTTRLATVSILNRFPQQLFSRLLTYRYDTGLRSPNKRIDKLNTILSTSSTLVPDGGFSLADVAVSSYLLYVVQFFPDIELYSKWPHIVRYMKECAQRENYQKAFGSNVQTFLLNRLEEMEATGGGGNSKGKKMFGMF